MLSIIPSIKYSCKKSYISVLKKASSPTVRECLPLDKPLSKKLLSLMNKSFETETGSKMKDVLTNKTVEHRETSKITKEKNKKYMRKNKLIQQSIIQRSQKMSYDMTRTSSISHVEQLFPSKSRSLVDEERVQYAS